MKHWPPATAPSQKQKSQKRNSVFTQKNANLHVATGCRALQPVAARCNRLPHVATGYRTLQPVASA
jgi:hypothetical protein